MTSASSSSDPLEESPGSNFAPNDGFATISWFDDSVSVAKVTNLNSTGTGSFRSAVSQSGPVLVVFEVSGTIDLGGDWVTITNDKVWVAGQTAPSPGIAITKGRVSIDANDCIVQHLRFRPGDKGAGNNDPDSLDSLKTADGTTNNVIDHCTATWSVDEVLSIGYNTGKTTVSNCLIAEALNNSIHSKGEHGYGSLTGDGATDVTYAGNVWAHNKARNPRLKKDTAGIVLNNLMHDFGEAANLDSRTTYTIEGNGFLNGDQDDYCIEGQGSGDDQSDVYLADNYANFDPPSLTNNYVDELSSRPSWPSGLEALASKYVEAHNFKHVGARPADRTDDDVRVIDEVKNGTRGWIDSQDDVGGYPSLAQNTRTLNVPDTGKADWLYERTKEVEPVPQVAASFTYTPSDPDTGEQISFDGSGTSGDIDSYEWDFTGDGTTDATGKTATHTYDSTGDYDVTLTVTSTTGVTDSSTQTVSVTGSQAAVTVTGDTIGSGGTEATMTIDADNVDHLSVSQIWTDWSASASGSYASFTDNVSESGTVEMDWDSEQGSVSVDVNLTPPTRYVAGEYVLEVDASNPDETAGATGTLVIGEPAPSVSTVGTSYVDSSSATASGSLDDLGGATSADVYFEYRQTGASSWSSTSSASRSSTGSYEHDVTGLASDTEYEYRAVADASDGDSATGSKQTFATSVDASNLVIEGGGDDIWDSADEFHYYYTSVSGDFDAVTAVASQENTSEWAKAGLMVRESTAADAANVMIRKTPGHETSVQWRSDAGQVTESTTSTEGESESEVTGGTIQAEYQRLVRTGDTFRAYGSTDGSNWTLIADLTASNVTLSDSVVLGLAVTSASSGTLCRTEFWGLGGVSPDQNQDVGTVVASGSVSGGPGDDIEVPPVVIADSATNVGTNSATLGGTLASLAGATSADVSFEYRQTGASSWSSTAAQSLSSHGSFSEAVSGLSAGTDYEFRAVAVGSDGGAEYSATATFTTST